jgi:hypothetical protein
MQLHRELDQLEVDVRGMWVTIDRATRALETAQHRLREIDALLAADVDTRPLSVLVP